MRRKRRNLNLNSNSRRNKAKINVGDLIVVVIFMIGFGLASIIGHQIFTDINTDIQADASIGAEAKEASSNLQDRYPKVLDGAFLLAVGLFWIFLIISSFMIDTHPIFFVVSIVLVIGTLIASSMLANVYEEVIGDSELSTYAEDFPVTNWFNGHLLLIAIAMGFSVVIALYGKSKFGV